MLNKGKIGLFLLFSVLNLNFISSQAEKSSWPEDDSKPFHYPTRGPIHLNSGEARNLKTPTPLTFNSDPKQLSIAENTGESLIIRPKDSPEKEHALITGGVLYKDIYKFFETEYFWDLDLKFDAGDKINGVGSPVQVVVSYFNTKYGTVKKALTKRDGIARIVLFVYVGSVTNFAFNTFKSELQPIKEAGSTTIIREYQSYSWYFKPSLIDDYYAYPGTYIDPKTGKIYYCATIIVLKRAPQGYISQKQFDATFGSFLNSAKKPYSHIPKIYPKGRRPLVHANGLVMGDVE